MDQIESLLEVQKMLDDIVEKMSIMKSDVDEVALCFKLKKIISNDVSLRVIEGLEEINSLNDKCQKMYSEINLKNKLSKDINDIKLTITNTISDLELNKKLVKYKRFLELETDEIETAVLLNEKKEELKEILSNYRSDNESELEPYDKFVEAVLELSSDESDYSMLVDYMTHLSKSFGNQLVGKTFIEKTIYYPLNRKDKNSFEENAEEARETAKEALKETREATEEAVIEAREAAEETVEEARETVEEAVEEIGEEIREATEEAVEETGGEAEEDAREVNTNRAANLEEEIFFNKIKDRGLLITEEVYSESFFAKISPAENKKFGVKIFINEMKARHTFDNVVSMRALVKNNSVTPELVAINSEEAKEKIELSLNYLQNKGYAREYGINGLGSFFCISPKGDKAVAAKNSRSFLRLRGEANKDSSEIIEDSLYPVLTRIAYSKLLTLYLDCLGKESRNIFNLMGLECFAVKIATLDKDRKFVFAGAFWNKHREGLHYIKKLREICNDDCENVVIAGLNLNTVKRLAEFIVEEIGLDTKKIYLYALLEDVFIAYRGEPVHLSSIIFLDELKEMVKDEVIDPIEDENVNKAKNNIFSEEKVVFSENNIIDEHEEETNSELEESGLSINEEKEIVRTEITDDIIEKVEKKEPVVAVNIGEMRNNAFQMIIDGKAYCATTYLRSLMEHNEDIKDLYKKLAYAVNDPWLRCSYNSNNIFFALFWSY